MQKASFVNAQFSKDCSEVLIGLVTVKQDVLLMLRLVQNSHDHRNDIRTVSLSDYDFHTPLRFKGVQGLHNMICAKAQHCRDCTRGVETLVLSDIHLARDTSFVNEPKY